MMTTIRGVATVTSWLLVGCSSGSSGSAVGGDASTDTTASEPNKVTLAVACEIPSPCGGALSGTWSLVSGCANVDKGCSPTSGGATATGDLEFKVDATSGRPFVVWQDRVNYNHCSRSGFANSDISGLYTIDGTTLKVEYTLGGTTILEYAYCVTGDDLWIGRTSPVFPTLAVRHFRRK